MKIGNEHCILKIKQQFKHWLNTGQKRAGQNFHMDSNAYRKRIQIS